MYKATGCMATCECYRNYVVSSVLVPLAKISNLGGHPSNLVRWKKCCMAELQGGFIIILSNHRGQIGCLVCSRKIIPQVHWFFCPPIIRWLTELKLIIKGLRATGLHECSVSTCAMCQIHKINNFYLLFSGSIHCFLYVVSFTLYSLFE